MRRAPDTDGLGEVIIEFVRNGAWLKCSAIHAATGKEASAVGPLNARERLETIATAKLRAAVHGAGPDGTPQDVVGRGWKA